MRLMLVAMLAGCACLWLAGPASAQKTEKQPEVASTIQIAGKHIDEWIAEIHSKDRSKSENAIRTVLMFDPDQAQRAVPALIAELKKGAYLDTSIRVNAAIALGEILSNAKNPDQKRIAEAVPLLTRLLHDGQAIVKYRAAYALGKLGTEGKTAISDLLALAKEQSTWELRQAAAFALGRVAQDRKNGPPEYVLSALFNMVRTDPAAQVRLSAIQALTWLGPPPNPAHQEQLEKALEFVAANDTEKTVQIWGHMALMNIKGKVQPARLAEIAKLLGNKELPVRIQAAQALGTIGPDAKTQIPALVAALDDPEKSVVGWSVWALMRIGKDALAVVPRLEQIARDTNEPAGIRQVAASAVEAIQGKTKATPKDAPKDLIKDKE